MATPLSEAARRLQTDRQRILTIISASSSNLIEWFCFYIYPFCAIHFASAFFPASDPTSRLLQVAGIFAVGFLARPVGGWLLGRLADQRGRRIALIYSGLMMCGGSLLIAITPTYNSIGYAAPVLLLIARLLQGLSVGGDYGTSATYMSEVAVKNREGFYASFQYVTLIGGQLLALLVIAILEWMLSETQLQEWGWRLPFILGAVAALLSLWLRNELKETTSQSTRQKKGVGTLQHLWQHKQALLTVFGFTAAGSLCFYTFTTYMQKYLINTAGMPSKTASSVMSAALFIYMLMQPVFGALSDRVGRRTMIIWFSTLMMAGIFPILSLIPTISNPLGALGLILTGLMILSLYTAVGGVIKAELFPIEVRALGVSLSHALANTLFGGSAEYVALWTKSLGTESSFYWYVTLLCLVSFIVSLRMPDLRRHGYLVEK